MRLRADTTPITLIPYCHSNFLVTVASNATVRYSETQAMPMPFGGGSFVDKVFHFANTAVPGGDLQDDKLSCSIEPATDTDDYYMSCSWLVVEFTEAANVVTI